MIGRTDNKWRGGKNPESNMSVSCHNLGDVDGCINNNGVVVKKYYRLAAFIFKVTVISGSSHRESQQHHYS